MPRETNDGTSFDDYLREEGMYEEVTEIAAARIRVWQLQEQESAESKPEPTPEPPLSF